MSKKTKSNTNKDTLKLIQNHVLIPEVWSKANTAQPEYSNKKCLELASGAVNIIALSSATAVVAAVLPMLNRNPEIGAGPAADVRQQHILTELLIKVSFGVFMLGTGMQIGEIICNTIYPPPDQITVYRFKSAEELYDLGYYPPHEPDSTLKMRSYDAVCHSSNDLNNMSETVANNTCPVDDNSCSLYDDPLLQLTPLHEVTNES